MILDGLFYGDAVVCVEPTLCTAAVCGLLTLQRLTLNSQIKKLQNPQQKRFNFYKIMGHKRAQKDNMTLAGFKYLTNTLERLTQEILGSNEIQFED